MTYEYREPPSHYSASVQTLWLRIAAKCKEPTRQEIERFYEVAYARGFLKKYPFLRKLVNSFLGDSLTPWQHLISSDLVKLDLSTSEPNSRAYANIDDEGTVILSNALFYNRILKTLNLAGNKIRAKGAGGLANVMKNNTTVLEEINLNNNKIGSTGCKLLALALKKNRTLRILHLRSNDLYDGAVADLSKALIGSNVEQLDLAGNQIRDAGAIAIAEVIRGDHLKQLDLSNNKIGNQGCIELARAILFNESLTSFLVRPSKSSLSTVAKQELVDALAAHPNLGSGSSKGASNSQLPEKEEEVTLFWWNEEERVECKSVPKPGPSTAPWSSHKLGRANSLDMFRKRT